MIGEDNGDGSKFAIILAWITICALFFMLFSCTKTVYQPYPEYHYEHDTIRHTLIRDSIIYRDREVRDSASFRKDGDTIFIEKWHWERDYRYEKILQARIDSLTKLKRDSIPYPVQVVKEVEKPLKKWQKCLIGWGLFCILALMISIYIRVRLSKAQRS